MRPFNVYGPGMRLDDKRVIPDFMSNALRNEPIVLFSAGKDTRTFCYISDATEAFLKILLSEFNGEAFNVGNDQGEITMNGLAEIINEISDKKPGVMHKQSQDQYYLKDNPHRRCPDLSKIKKLIGYEPKVGLKPGLKKLMEWYKQVYF